MLNREINSINTAVYQAWSRISAQYGGAYNRAVNDMSETFRKDFRITVLAAALADVGYDDTNALAWTVSQGTGFYGMTRRSGKGLYNDMQTAIAGIKNATEQISTDPAYMALGIALATSKKKWPALQPDVYTFVADISAAKDYDELRTAIRKFTGALA